MDKKGFDKDTLKEYAPWLVLVLMFLFQYNVFVTPVELERRTLEIYQNVALKYATKEQTDDLKKSLVDIQQKIDKIYEKIIK